VLQPQCCGQVYDFFVGNIRVSRADFADKETALMSLL
jgi:hypothetical protein